MLITLGAVPEKAASTARVRAMTAKLYYSNSGTFSPNLINNQDFHLWNTIIGEGSAAGPSTATLIEVEVSGRYDTSALSNDSLTITTQQGKGPAKVYKTDHLNFSRGDKFFRAVWVEDTGCQTLYLTAKLNGQNAVRRAVPFECGE